MAKADHKDAYNQLPVCEEHRMLAVVTLKGPDPEEMRGLSPHTQLSGATAAVFYYDAVSREMATLAV